ncbi:MAG TPA: helix-turn-helix domain-containing protein [Bauldia sp.]|nr:helix-turn-helix domain-containing protein [Bauldia sp.]
MLDHLESQFHSFGSSHFLATGLPLPGRAVEPLVLRANWGDLRTERLHEGSIDPNDAILNQAIACHRVFTASGEDEARLAEGSALARLAGPPGQMRLVVVPLQCFRPYQAVVIAAGRNLAVDTERVLAADIFAVEAFRRLFDLGVLSGERPGDLSARERRVVALSAAGKTANQIAADLDISRRTVHAHLQNASDKLKSRNKTQTVVEALRYGQIAVWPPLT